jgi:MFS transporter, putative metabolite:H+ symporter
MAGSSTIFDEILEKKVKFGKYQLLVYLFMAFTMFSDGSEIVTLSILVPVLQHTWNISEAEEGLLGSILFFGIFIGSLLSGMVSDKFGRRVALLYGSIIQVGVGIISAYVNDIVTFIIVRGIFGLFIGFTVPLAPAMGSELTPIELRGRGVVVINFFFSLGKIFGVLVAKGCLDTINSGDWRKMLILASLPALIVWFGTWIWVKESPRFLIATGKVKEGVEILNHVAEYNNPGTEKISPEEIEQLEAWAQKSFSESVGLNPKSTLSALFSPKLKRISTVMFTMWFSLNFTFFGMVFILPIMLSYLDNLHQTKSTGLDGLLYTLMGELPSSFIALLIIEREAFGRKKTILYSQAAATVIFFIAFFGPNEWLIPLFTVSRAFLKLSFAIIYPLTIELYPTSARTSGFGFSSGFGRLGNALGPPLLLALFDLGLLVPALGFGIASLIMTVAVYMLPYDTRGRALDVIDNENDSQNVPLKEFDALRGK